MKLLILFAFVACAAADSHLFDPAKHSYECCLMCGDPVIRTFDGAYLMLLNETKNLMSQWDFNRANPCKLQMRCVTKDDYCGDSVMAPIWIDWCGIGVWSHSNGKDIFRNWMFGQNLEIFGERGQGNGGTIDGIHAIWPNTHTFPRAGEQFNNAASPEYWNPAVPRPTCATNPYEMWIDQTNDVISLRSHFDCCGWAVDFWPRGRDTCVNLYAQNNNTNIEAFKKDDKRVDGICGNMDGDIANDWRTCSISGKKWQKTVNNVNSLKKISSSCNDGINKGLNYMGGRKLDSTVIAAGFTPKCPVWP